MTIQQRKLFQRSNCYGGYPRVICLRLKPVANPRYHKPPGKMYLQVYTCVYIRVVTAQPSKRNIGIRDNICGSDNSNIELLWIYFGSSCWIRLRDIRIVKVHDTQPHSRPVRNNTCQLSAKQSIYVYYRAHLQYICNH